MRRFHFHGVVGRASACAALLLSVVAGCTPELKGEAVIPPRDLPSYDFTLANGAAFSTAPIKRSVTLLFFGYTHCPDICPTTLADWKRVHAQLGADTARVRFVFVSIDPTRDTKAITESYVRGYHPSFIGLAGDSTTIWRMVKSFGIAVIPDNASAGAPAPIAMPAQAGPTMAHDHAAAGQLIGHSSQAFLLNDQGQLVAMYPPGTSWQLLLGDLKAVL
jgi:protein SCO1